MDLFQVWRDDVIAAGYEPVPAHWEELDALFEGRPYHNAEHAREVRDWVVTLQGSHAARIAAWYHDSIYEPGGEGNEIASASLARSHLELAGATPALAEDVERLILLTEKHDPASGDRNGEIISDADLAILGSDPERYTEYVTQIREEYGFLADREFWTGRIGVLERLLDRPAIYRTEPMKERESQAIVNMRTELGWLQIQIGNSQGRRVALP